MRLAEDVPDGPKGDHFGRTGIRYLTITVEDFDDLLARCEAAGHPAVYGPTSMGPVRIAIIEDPEGNRVELLGRS